jgi:hypothetical protein
MVATARTKIAVCEVGDRLVRSPCARSNRPPGRPAAKKRDHRAASTFLAMDAPEKIGLIPGVFQHASPDVSDQHYNLARSMQAGRRFAAHLANVRNRLRPLATKKAG